MTIRLIAADMDGTFLDARGHYDRQRFSRLLDQLEDRDIRFVVATGNSMKRLGVLFDGFLDRIDIVAENGAHVLSAGKTLARQSIAPELVQGFLSYMTGKEQRYSLSLTSQDQAYMLEGTRLPDFDGIAPDELIAMRQQIHYVSDWDQVSQAITKMNLEAGNHAQELSQAINQQFPGRLRAITSGFGGIDILAEGCHKAAGLAVLLDHYGLSMDQVMSFGDSQNDLELLKRSGLSYAMANASQEVKAAAKAIAPSHTENGVFTIIEAFIATS